MGRRSWLRAVSQHFLQGIPGQRFGDSLQSDVFDKGILGGIAGTIGIEEKVLVPAGFIFDFLVRLIEFAEADGVGIGRGPFEGVEIRLPDGFVIGRLRYAQHQVRIHGSEQVKLIGVGPGWGLRLIRRFGWRWQRQRLADSIEYRIKHHFRHAFGAGSA